VLIVGKTGILVAGPHSRQHEDLLLCYLSLLSRDMFIRVFFTRVFVLQAKHNKIRGDLAVYEKDPNTVSKVRMMLSECGRDIISLMELLGYLHESLMDIEPPQRPGDMPGKRLHTILDCDKMKRNVQLRVDDLEATVHVCQAELDNLQQACNVINTKQVVHPQVCLSRRSVFTMRLEFSARLCRTRLVFSIQTP
jgi:WD repeat-containing protein 35